MKSLRKRDIKDLKLYIIDFSKSQIELNFDFDNLY